MNKKEDFHIDDYNHIGSSVGNAYFSGVSFSQLWDCMVISSNREELDASIDATIKMNKIVKGESNDR